MRLSKQEIIDHIIDLEGGYVDDPSDSGGETHYGITVNTARAYGYSGSMIDLPRSLAFTIYAERYWDAVAGDELALVSSRIAAEVVDTSINMGSLVAGKMLQRSLNCFCLLELKVDGMIGPKSCATLINVVGRRGEDVVLKALNCLQGARYIKLCEKRKKDKKFIFGWLQNRVVI